jgi:hypothetical protein
MPANRKAERPLRVCRDLRIEESSEDDDGNGLGLARDCEKFPERYQLHPRAY